MRFLVAPVFALILSASGSIGLGTAHADELAAAASQRAPVVGLQVGHWQAQLLPEELAVLRSNFGAERDGYRELDANYAVTQAAARALRASGVQVDILPATVPADYRADAFVSLHSDQEVSEHARGYKIAASAMSQNRAGSRSLAADVADEYAAQTGLPRDARRLAVTPDMRYYYAFNSTDFKHAIDPATPAAILELGFITDADDRAVIFEQPEAAGQAVAAGILRFLQVDAGQAVS